MKDSYTIHNRKGNSFGDYKTFFKICSEESLKCTYIYTLHNYTSDTHLRILFTILRRKVLESRLRTCVELLKNKRRY